ncbi:DUF1835 domain-containing protein [Halomonas binhaiensis]|uniref:DUF1835 domain-containing protein n=1 Tax=Halomonas binhaiensis TaxID=2562282 RepID=A0A856QPG5_9GAMM|nr:DUF1835 domain-containing protein [Halomonas binhaiensis]QEM81814.2 DUF1835 domain-containing protein [Halomonas binhaiensis]
MTTRSQNDPLHHGRFNLAQQYTRAEALLEAWQADEPDALDRALAYIPERQTPLRLAEAKWVVAQESGFPDWARLEAHVEALDMARKLVAEQGDRDRSTLHIRCGSDIKDSLETAGFQGDFLEFSDPFCMGPLQDVAPDELMQLRASYLSAISKKAGMKVADIKERLRQSYAGLETLDNYERVVLWFEHDSYDQLLLAYLLHRLYLRPVPAIIELIAVESIPGVKRFVGIGQLAPDVLAWLWLQRRPVTTSLMQLGSQAWTALTSDNPQALKALVNSSTPALPMMAKALARHLQELPEKDSGLGLTERLILEIVRDHGPLPVGKTFAYLMAEREPLPYLGDLMFWWLLQPLITAPQTVLEISDTQLDWPHRQLVLTALGQSVVEGNACWLNHVASERWVGGIRIAPGQSAYTAIDVN